MDHQPDRFDYLYRQYINRSCTYEEMRELYEYISDPALKDRLDALAYEHLEGLQVPERLPEIDWEHMYSKIIPQQGGVVVRIEDEPRGGRFLIWRKIAVAAAILIVLAAGGYWWLGHTPKGDVTFTNNKPAVTNDVAPGGNKAILTLGDNSTIMLDSAANGQLAQQGKTTVIKSGEGQLRYDAKALTIDHSPLTYNKLATPRGGQYQLILPDGSRVWLNAASSIRYPTAFTGNERNVEITGEAYFEVAKDAMKPFRVQFVSAGKQGVVEVIGTHFNINAYEDEPAIKATLLEGSVKVSKDMASVILKPGEQTSVSQKSQPSHPIPVQTEEAVAWKNGLFSFKAADIKSVMRQLERWYDVDVEYETEVKEKFYVEMNRNTNVSNVFKILETTGGVHFKIEGKKIIVMK